MQQGYKVGQEGPSLTHCQKIMKNKVVAAGDHAGNRDQEIPSVFNEAILNFERNDPHLTKTTTLLLPKTFQVQVTLLSRTICTNPGEVKPYIQEGGAAVWNVNACLLL